MKINPIEYLRKLTLGGNQESSKRFIALYTVIVLITVPVMKYTDHSNLAIVLGILTGFVSALLTVAAYESIKGVNKNKPPEEELPN